MSRRSRKATRRPLGLAMLVLGLSLATGCTTIGSTAAAVSRAATPPVPVTQWDHRPEARDWTLSTMGAIARHGTPLIETPLADIEAFCPGYNTASEVERKAFWVGLFSGLARFESTWNPRAAGAGGRYRGLLQIWPTTARFRGCEINGPDDLFDGALNLACAVRIAAAAVARDGVVAGGPGNWGGVAADWPPLRNARKRAEIAAFTRSQSYCQKGGGAAGSPAAILAGSPARRAAGPGRAAGAARGHSTVTDLARLRGWSTSVPLATAV